MVPGVAQTMGAGGVLAACGAAQSRIAAGQGKRRVAVGVNLADVPTGPRSALARRGMRTGCCLGRPAHHNSPRLADRGRSACRRPRRSADSARPRATRRGSIAANLRNREGSFRRRAGWRRRSPLRCRIGPTPQAAPWLGFPPMSPHIELHHRRGPCRCGRDWQECGGPVAARATQALLHESCQRRTKDRRCPAARCRRSRLRPGRRLSAGMAGVRGHAAGDAGATVELVPVVVEAAPP